MSGRQLAQARHVGGSQRPGQGAEQPGLATPRHEALELRRAQLSQERAAALHGRVDHAAVGPGLGGDGRQFEGRERSGRARVGVGGRHDADPRVLVARRAAHRGEQGEGLVVVARPEQPDLHILHAAAGGPRGRQGGHSGQVGEVADGNADGDLGRSDLAHTSDDMREVGAQRALARILDVHDVRVPGDGGVDLVLADHADE